MLQEEIWLANAHTRSFSMKHIPKKKRREKLFWCYTGFNLFVTFSIASKCIVFTMANSWRTDMHQRICYKNVWNLFANCREIEIMKSTKEFEQNYEWERMWNIEWRKTKEKERPRAAYIFIIKIEGEREKERESENYVVQFALIFWIIQCMERVNFERCCWRCRFETLIKIRIMYTLTFYGYDSAWY